MRHSYHNIRSFVENDKGHNYNCFHTIDIYFKERNEIERFYRTNLSFIFENYAIAVIIHIVVF